MPSFVHKIDVNSPLIQYQGPWIRGGSKADPRGPDADPEQPKYDQETFVFCFPGNICSATLNFNGTEIHVVGAFRANSGPVQVQLDGESFGPFAPTPDERIHNNSSVAFVYAPSDAWSTDMSRLPGFDDGTGHSTFNRADATVNFSFMGDRIALYGAIGGQAAPFTAQVDNGPIRSLTEMQSISDEATEDYLPNQLIYYADSLGAGNHTIFLKSQSSSPSQTLSIDYALVDGNDNTASSTSSSPSLISPSTQGTRSLTIRGEDYPTSRETITCDWHVRTLSAPSDLCTVAVLLCNFVVEVI
ncbi:hypothetical protein GGX14DRAFT_408611 [Mycena pura]|uniref:Uncharacterized protein n=1 Tax=Mycena pura TaxID=153505 RepID=A0AAD6UKQ2_9AGAR|nr:hypothetical protein GGX14DRAFT_408611 [Mycena pura]